MDEIAIVKSGAEVDALPAETTTVKGDGVKDADLAGLTRLPALTTLYLDGCFDLTDEALRLLGGLPALAELYLSSRHVTDEGLRHLAAAKGLRELGLDLLATGEGLVYLAGLTELEELHLPGWPNLDPDHLRQLAPLPKIRKICFYNCAAMTPAVAADLCIALPRVDFEVR